MQITQPGHGHAQSSDAVQKNYVLVLIAEKLCAQASTRIHLHQVR